ncbi:hypothetical protein BVY02_00985 [bacterium J17]|nr:hypothetical protein BVY02_00985 [bacterium J17]
MRLALRVLDIRNFESYFSISFLFKLVCVLFLFVTQLVVSPAFSDSSQAFAQDTGSSQWSFGSTTAGGNPAAPGCQSGSSCDKKFEWVQEKPGVLSCRLNFLINSDFGMLLTGIAGIAAIFAAAMGSYRASWSFVIVACSAFTLQVFVNAFYPPWDYSDQCEFTDPYFVDKIIKAYCYLMVFIQGPLGGLVATAAGIGAIVASAAGSTKTAWVCLYVSVGSFILSSLVSLFFAPSSDLFGLDCFFLTGEDGWDSGAGPNENKGEPGFAGQNQGAQFPAIGNNFNGNNNSGFNNFSITN